MLLGIPTEVYIYGTQYLSAGLINILVVVITIYIYMPVFYELQLTSVFEVCIKFARFWACRYTNIFPIQFQYLELRFNSKIRAFTSLLFGVYLILYIPVVIYVPALAFNQGISHL